VSAVIPPADEAMATMPYGFTGSALSNSGVFTPTHPVGSVGSGRADSRAWGQLAAVDGFGGGHTVRRIMPNPDVDVDEGPVRLVRR